MCAYSKVSDYVLQCFLYVRCYRRFYYLPKSNKNEFLLSSVNFKPNDRVVFICFIFNFPFSVHENSKNFLQRNLSGADRSFAEQNRHLKIAHPLQLQSDCAVISSIRDFSDRKYFSTSRMAQYINFSIRRFFQTSAARQAAKAAGEEDHQGKYRRRCVDWAVCFSSVPPNLSFAFNLPLHNGVQSKGQQ